VHLLRAECAAIVAGDEQIGVSGDSHESDSFVSVRETRTELLVSEVRPHKCQTGRKAYRGLNEEEGRGTDRSTASHKSLCKSRECIVQVNGQNMASTDSSDWC
jgi:hypothetical protein